MSILPEVSKPERKVRVLVVVRCIEGVLCADPIQREGVMDSHYSLHLPGLLPSELVVLPVCAGWLPALVR